MSTVSMLKIGETPYVSTLPLYWPMRTRLGEGQEFVSGRLTDLTSALSKGEIDVGPITLVEYLRKPDNFQMLPRLSLSSLGRSGCMLLYTRKPVYELKESRIAVPGWAVGAIALLKWLMKEMYRFEPSLVERQGSVEENLAQYDGVLMFQDQALKAATGTSDLLHVWDLGEVWWQITNTPFIYMIWAARKSLPEADVAALSDLFAQAKAAYPAEREAVVAEAQNRVDMPAPVVEGYLSRFNYDFTPAHQSGLDSYQKTVLTLATV
jgi:chorismate dehydratase